MTHPTSTTHHFGLYYSVNFAVLHGQYSNLVKSTTKSNRFKYNFQKWFPQQLLKTLRIHNLKFHKTFWRFRKILWVTSFSASIYKKKYCGKKFNTHGRYCGTCPKRGKGSIQGPVDQDGSSLDGPCLRSSSAELGRLNCSSDGFFKQASSEHSLLTQKILLEIRRNTTLIPPGYHTNTHINVP